MREKWNLEQREAKIENVLRLSGFEVFGTRYTKWANVRLLSWDLLFELQMSVFFLAYILLVYFKVNTYNKVSLKFWA